MCNITNKLKEIATQIPDDVSVMTINDFKFIENGITKYKLKNGCATSRSLLCNEKISIALTAIPDGGFLREHEHVFPVKYELIMLLEGTLKMNIGGKETLIEEEEFVKIERNIKHDALAIGDVLLVALTIPKDEGFPE
jgi:quercetin dioxygenase-like cupin family protein